MRPIADLHVHSLASGHAFNTVEELAHYAKRRGVKYLAITDHGPQMPGGPHEYYFYNMKILPEVLHGVRLLKGVEANIIDMDGNLDLDDNYIRTLDIVIASCHEIVSPENMDVAENTKMLLNVLRKPYVDIIGHLENPGFPVNVKEVVGAAKEAGKLIEINNASFTIARRGSYETCIEIMKELKAQKMSTVINSDAHIGQLIGEVSAAWKVAREIGITKDQIINFSKDRMEAYLKDKRQKF